MCALDEERHALPDTGSNLKERRHERVQSTAKEHIIGTRKYRTADVKERRLCPH